jgi:hypothetical protein
VEKLSRLWLNGLGAELFAARPAHCVRAATLSLQLPSLPA